MKIFSNVFDLAKPTGRKFNVETNSDYAIGIKIANDGVAQEGTIKLFLGETELSAEADKVDGFTIYNRTSGSSKESNEYQVVYVNDGISSYFDLLENVCDTGVFEKGTGSGGGSYTLPVATQTTLGGVKFNPEYGVKVDGEGFMAMATASTESIGGVIVGSGLSIDMNTGVLSAVETDPAFNTWLSGESILAGSGTSSNGGKAVAIGYNAQNAGYQNGVAIGNSTKVRSGDGIAIGSGSTAANNNGIAIGQSCYAMGNSVAIGYNAKNQKDFSIAIGSAAQTNVVDGIQIGNGTVTTQGDCQIWSYPILNMSDGYFKAARLGTGYDATKTQVLKNVNGTLTWVDEA